MAERQSFGEVSAFGGRVRGDVVSGGGFLAVCVNNGFFVCKTSCRICLTKVLVLVPMEYSL